MNEKNKSAMLWGREYLIAFGFLFISSGSAGYERYMLQGNLSAAVFDVALSIIGVLIMARGLGRPA